ncbi:MAG: DUF2207 domain-containing protein, partial [Patescibacteria group bacterium]
MSKFLTPLFLSAIALIFLASPAFAKDYSLGKVDISVTVNTDRSFQVRETRIYNFEGSFSWADLWIPTEVTRDGYSYEIAVSDFTVYDETGTILQTKTDTSKDQFYAKWFYSAEDERKTFTWTYEVSGDAIKKHKNIAEFYWQAIGRE